MSRTVAMVNGPISCNEKSECGHPVSVGFLKNRRRRVIGEWRCDGADREVGVRKSEAITPGTWRDGLQSHAPSTLFCRNSRKVSLTFKLYYSGKIQSLGCMGFVVENFLGQMTAAALISTPFQYH